MVAAHVVNDARSSATSTALPPPPDPDPRPTENFAKAAEAVGFYDARAVAGRLVVAGCHGLRVLDESLGAGRDVPDLAIPESSCASIVGVSGSTLVVYAKGAGILGVDVPGGAVRWRAPTTLSAACDRGEQAKEPFGGPAGTRWSRHEFLDATRPSTCRSIVVSGTTVVSHEAPGTLVGRSAQTGVERWRHDAPPLEPGARFLADDHGHVFEPLPGNGTLRGMDASNGQTLWQVRLDHLSTEHSGTSAPQQDDSAANWDTILGSIPPGPWVRWTDRTVALSGQDGADLASVARDPASSSLFTSLGPYVLSRKGSGPVASDARSVFATDENGSIVAYRRPTGDKEWSCNILALGLEMIPKPLFTQPRLEWLGSEEILVGLGIGPTGVAVLSLFRKLSTPTPDRTVTVLGDVVSWAGPSDDRSWMRIRLGANETTPDAHGHFSLRVVGHGKLRLYSPDGWSMKSHLEPQTTDVDLEGASVVQVKLAVVRHQEPHETPQPGQ